MSRDMRRAWNVISHGTGRLTQQFGRRPTEVEVADHVGVSLEQLRLQRRHLSGQIHRRPPGASVWLTARNKLEARPHERTRSNDLNAR
jgi:hypothetical protein